MRLEVKKQKAKNASLFLRINCSKQCTRDFFTGWNASSKVRPNYLEVLKHQESYGWCFLEAKRHQNSTKHDFIGSKTLSKVNLVY